MPSVRLLLIALEDRLAILTVGVGDNVGSPAVHGGDLPAIAQLRDRALSFDYMYPRTPRRSALPTRCRWSVREDRNGGQPLISIAAIGLVIIQADSVFA